MWQTSLSESFKLKVFLYKISPAVRETRAVAAGEAHLAGDPIDISGNLVRKEFQSKKIWQ